MAMQSTIHTSPSRDRADVTWTRRFHALLLAGSLLVPILGMSMTLEPHGRVSLPGLEGYPLPTLCVSRQLGFECATCGVTRSIIALMHGNWARSLQFHRFGWWIALLIVAQIPYRGYRILRPAARLPALEAAGMAILAVTALFVLGNWLFGLIGLA